MGIAHDFSERVAAKLPLSTTSPALVETHARQVCRAVAFRPSQPHLQAPCDEWIKRTVANDATAVDFTIYLYPT